LWIKTSRPCVGTLSTGINSTRAACHRRSG
jgi:hypothetical protein